MDEKKIINDVSAEQITGGDGRDPQPGDNPNSSECPNALCWWSSPPGYICNGEVICN